MDMRFLLEMQAVVKIWPTPEDSDRCGANGRPSVSTGYSVRLLFGGERLQPVCNVLGSEYKV